MASGYLDGGSASSLVNSAFFDASNKASSAFSQAQSLIGQLANAINIASPVISTPSQPDMPSMASMPGAPSVNMPTLGTVAIGNAPTLDRIDVPDVPIPAFTATAPNIVLPDMPHVTEPADPGTAPNMDDVSLPNDPDIVLPDPPTLSAVTVPTFTDLALPVSDAERPDVTIDMPGKLFVYQAGEWASDLQQTVEQQIYDGLLSGGNIAAIAGIAAYIEQVRSEAARGLDGPTGADADREQQAQWRYSDTVNERVAQVVGKQCELTVQHFEFLIEHGISAVGLRLDAYNKAQDRALESAKATAEFGYRMVDTQIAVHNLQLARYQADTTAYEVKLRAVNTVLEDRKVQLETARVRGDLRKQDVDVYVAECQAQMTRVEVFKAQIQGALAKIEAQTKKIDAFKAKVDAFVAQTNAMVARYNAWAQQIAAQKTKVELYQAQAGVYATEVGAQKVAADIGATKAQIVDARNKGSIALYQAGLEGTKVELQRLIAQVDASLKTATAQVQLYDASVRGTAAENESRRGLAALQVQEWATLASTFVEQAKVALEYARVKGSLSEQALQACAATAAQLAASALGSRHATASVGFSGSTSNSNSFNQNYNYSQSESA